MEREAAGDTLGCYLRALREAKGASLEEMARSTRVSLRHFRALEADQISELPAAVFVKGFLQAYCAYLGEPADEALARFRSTVLQGSAPAAKAASAGRSAWAGSPLLVSAILLLLLGAALIVLNLGVRRAPQPPVPQPEATVESGPAAPAASTVPPAAPPAPPAPAGAQRLVIRAVEATWIRVQTDDGRITEELLQPGATREWTSQRRFLLTVGNAGGVEVEVNGRVVPPLGARGAVIHRLELPRPEPNRGS